MKITLAFLLALSLIGAPSARASDLTATLDGVTVTLTQAPCAVPEVLAALKREYHAQFRQGRAVFPDRTVALCWSREVQPGAILIVDAEGDHGLLPASIFREGI